MIHIHNNHDLSNGVVIFCVMGKKPEGGAFKENGTTRR